MGDKVCHGVKIPPSSVDDVVRIISADPLFQPIMAQLEGSGLKGMSYYNKAKEILQGQLSGIEDQTSSRYFCLRHLHGLIRVIMEYVQHPPQASVGADETGNIRQLPAEPYF